MDVRLSQNAKPVAVLLLHRLQGTSFGSVIQVSSGGGSPDLCLMPTVSVLSRWSPYYGENRRRGLEYRRWCSQLCVMAFPDTWTQQTWSCCSRTASGAQISWCPVGRPRTDVTITTIDSVNGGTGLVLGELVIQGETYCSGYIDRLLY